MTEKQIKQNAEEYADAFCSRDDQTGMWQECCNIFIAGAHSRDEEIKQWKESKRKLRLRLIQQIHELRNPWISVEERLPEKEQKVFVMFGDTDIIGIGYLDDVEEIWLINGWGSIDDVTHWMQIPQIEKGE